MKKITLLFMMLFYTCIAFTQVFINENFDSGTPTNWTTDGSYQNESGPFSCGGNGGSERVRLNQFDTTNSALTTPNFSNASNETDLTISFDYKIVQWSSLSIATSLGFGTAELRYSTNNGATWTTVLAINDTNHTVSTSCATINATIPAASLPLNSDIKLQIANTWGAEDYYFYVDNFKASQVLSAPPNCDALLTETLNINSTGDISWSIATGNTEGYSLTVGTTAGASDLLNNIDVGNVTSYSAGSLTAGTSYYITITPYNSAGNATGCAEQIFSTGNIPTCATNTISTIDATCGLLNTTANWDSVADATSYNITVGTTSGGNDVLDNVNTGNVTSYAIENQEVNTTYYWSISPVNNYGMTSGCIENTYTTSTINCYCTSIPTDIDDQGFINVQLNATDFPSTGDVTYEDFTGGSPIDLYQGLLSNLQITFGTGYSYSTYVWIDFNDDFVFDDTTELVFTGLSNNNNPTILNASFTMPPTANIGIHRMRIGAQDSENLEDPLLDATPCYNGPYGVTTDIDVNISTASCSQITATYTTVLDCNNNEFSVDVDVTSLGSANSYDVQSEGLSVGTITNTSINTFGPFTNDTPVDLTIIHPDDAVCNFTIFNLVNQMCPTLVTCGTPVNTTFCYVNSDNTQLPYKSIDGKPLTVTFNSGMTEDNFDELIILDSDGVTALYSGYGNSGDLTGLTYTSTGDTIYITVTSDDNTINCTSAPWDFDVSCDGTLSTANIDDNISLSYYPNPVSNTLNLNAKNIISNVSVYNMLGQEILNTKPNTTAKNINMPNLESGTYFVRVTIGQTIKTFKIIKK